MKIISLFSGAGGMDLGFKEAGFDCVLASDIMLHAESTYKKNFPEIKFIKKDIRLLSVDEIKKIVGNQKIDVIIGGPPCQGFSNMWNKNSADPSNNLFEKYVDIVNAVQPKCFVFENVRVGCFRIN